MSHSFRLADITANTLEDTEARIESLKVRYRGVGLELHLHPNDLRPGRADTSTRLPDYRIGSPRLIALCESIVIHLRDGRQWLDKAPVDGYRWINPDED